MFGARERPIFGNDIGLVNIIYCVSRHIGLDLVGFDADDNAGQGRHCLAERNGACNERA
jgi:hypothetical protein